VVFALVTTAAFAQLSIGGNMKISTLLLAGTTANSEVRGNPVLAGSAQGTTLWDAYTNVSWSGDSAGGMMRLYTGTNEHQESIFAFWWWRPIDQLRIQLGQNPDGDFGADQISGWGYMGEAQGGIVIEEWRFTDGNRHLGLVARNVTRGSPRAPRQFAPGFSALGLTMSVVPIDGLSINLGVPFAQRTDWRNTYTNIYANVTYNIEDIGTARLSAQFRPGSQERLTVEPTSNVAREWEKPDYYWRGQAEPNAGNNFTVRNELHDPMTLWGSFFVTAIENINIDIGVGYRLPFTTQAVKLEGGRNIGGLGTDTNPTNSKDNAPVSVGLAATYRMDDLSIKFRSGFAFAGSRSLVNPTENRLNAFNNVQGTHLFTTNNQYFHVKDNSIQAVNGTMDTVKDPFVWAVGILPSYRLPNRMTVFMNLGMGMRHYPTQEIVLANGDRVEVDWSPHNNTNDRNRTYSLISKENVIKSQQQFTELGRGVGLDQVTADMNWFVNPYVTIPTGTGTFYAGFLIFTDGDRIPVRYEWNNTWTQGGSNTSLAPLGNLHSSYRVQWAIPIGWNVYF